MAKKELGSSFAEAMTLDSPKAATGKASSSSKKVSKKAVAPKKKKKTSPRNGTAPVKTYTKAFSITEKDRDILEEFMTLIRKDASKEGYRVGSYRRGYTESFALRFAIRAAKYSQNIGTDLEKIRKELEAEDGRATRHSAA